MRVISGTPSSFKPSSYLKATICLMLTPASHQDSNWTRVSLMPLFSYANFRNAGLLLQKEELIRKLPAKAIESFKLFGEGHRRILGEEIGTKKRNMKGKKGMNMFVNLTFFVLFYHTLKIIRFQKNIMYVEYNRSHSQSF